MKTREEFDEVPEIKKIHITPRRDGKVTLYLECSSKQDALTLSYFIEGNEFVVNVFEDNEDSYLISLFFPKAHYKRDIIKYKKAEETELFRMIRMKKYEIIGAAYQSDVGQLTSFPEYQFVCVHQE